MIKKTSSNQPCGRYSEYITGAFLKSFSIFYNITRCYSNGEYCHVFAIAAGDIIKYQGGHTMRNADARTVRSRQETFNSNCGHET